MRRRSHGRHKVDMNLLAFEIQLFPDGTMFIHIGIILLMIYVLNRTLYRPINRVLEAREKNKGNYFGEAEEIQQKVADKESQYQKDLLDARSAGYALIEKEQKKATTAREKKLAEAKAETAEQLASGRSDVQQQTAAARAALEKEADVLADKIATGILKK